MVLAFTEAEKKQIESCGIMVVEFKRSFRMIESMSKAVYKALDILIKLAETVAKVCYEVCKKFNEVIDDIRLACEKICENYAYPTSRRYKVVKILSKCTGLEKKEIWKMTRRTHWARSCC